MESDLEKKEKEIAGMERKQEEVSKEAVERVREKKKFKIRQLKNEVDALNADIEK